jgi:hypothetical protein
MRRAARALTLAAAPPRRAAPAGELSALKILDLQDNELGGTLPASTDNLVALQHLDLSGNNFTGAQGPRLPSGARACAVLVADGRPAARASSMGQPIAPNPAARAASHCSHPPGNSTVGLDGLAAAVSLLDLRIGNNPGLGGTWPLSWGSLVSLVTLDAPDTAITGGSGAMGGRVVGAKRRRWRRGGGEAHTTPLACPHPYGVPGTLPSTWGAMTQLKTLNLSRSHWEPGYNPDPAWPAWETMAALEVLDLSWGNGGLFTGASGPRRRAICHEGWLLVCPCSRLEPRVCSLTTPLLPPPVAQTRCLPRGSPATMACALCACCASTATPGPPRPTRRGATPRSPGGPTACKSSTSATTPFTPTRSTRPWTCPGPSCRCARST